MEGDVGIVIPAYNPDPERLTGYIERLQAELSPERIHVELDAPTPATRAALETSSVTVFCSPDRRGKGAAVTAGFDRLTTDIRGFVDADGSTPPDSLRGVIEPVLADEANLSVGSRRHPDAVVRVHQSRIRRRLGDLFVQIARRILPIQLYDYQCGAKAIDAATWESVREELVSPGFAWDIEFVTIAHALGAEVVEVPIVWEDQPGSTVGLAGTASEFGLGLLRACNRAAVIRGNPIHSWIARSLGRSTRLIDTEQLAGHESTEST